MKSAATLFAILFSITTFQTALAKSLTAEEKKGIQRTIINNIKIKTKARVLENSSIQKTFSAKFYDVTITQHDIAEGSSSAHNRTLVKQGNKFIYLESPTTDEPLPKLFSMLNKQFMLKNQKDAQILEEALDTIYPISTSFGTEDLDKKAIRQEGNQWIFIRGGFFDKLMGFVFQTDSGGRIQSVSYSLNIDG
ncbi:hypothetical protein [Endozoicomonas elysicola]|uniref:Uncharacterized protein n=1 Tax=Endozoicomonas elysicola TaxID=305900 RepID=A0A081K5E7_9GAMM|nr:hypothetical protein [Endozoicomonas elysicola]KEI69373.1 hypothetical protein GV64_00235 [Endozoicomonas elysicola]